MCLRVINIKHNMFIVSRFIIREGNGTPLQHSCLENPRDGGAWWAAVHVVAKSWTRLSDFTFTFHFHALEKEMATTPVFCLENPRDGGAWWAAIYGVAQSRTRLKQQQQQQVYYNLDIFICLYLLHVRQQGKYL